MLASNNQVISKRIGSVMFGYYSPDEVRRLSVKEIKNLKAFDQLNNPTIGGLYDPAMGVQPHDRGSRCVTCGQESFNCTGHIGHIELILPVYNPFLVNKLLSLLRSKCYFCHKLRITKERKKYYKTKFRMLRLGLLTQMKEYDSLNTQRIKTSKFAKLAKKDSSRKESGDTTTKAISEKSHEIFYQDVERSQAVEKLEGILKQMKDLKNLTKVKNHIDLYAKGVQMTSHIQYELKHLTKLFYKEINKKCPHCKKASQVVRKEGLSKFFLVERSQKGSKRTDVIIQQNPTEGEEKEEKSKKSKQNYMSPYEIHKHMELLWQNDSDLLKLLFGSIYLDKNTLEQSKRGYELQSLKYSDFFIEVLPVTANRFRPENKLGEQTFLHGHTVAYTRILEINQELRIAVTNLNGTQSSADTQRFKENNKPQIERVVTLEGIFQKWIELQDCVIGLFNSEKAQNKANRENNGVKQLLERKQGLFRMKMMGKRVNFAARSVISPDPLMNTNEVGVPLILARKLVIPENVNQHNLKQCGELIMNGPEKYPGALFFEEDGRKTSLEFLNPQQRQAIVRELGSGYNKIVWRQLHTGDVMLFNRQPTLHKPSIMAHVVRVLPNEQTIRFHYANCKSYNADFDGDEMNLHFLQNYIARAEALQIAMNDQQYISPTNGKPIRELMQDMIVSAVFLTMRTTFLTRFQFQQLLYSAVWNFFSGQSTSDMSRIEIVPPAILRPKQLWTGKQLITSIMRTVVRLGGYNPDIGLNMEAKAKIGKNELPGPMSDDSMVVVKNNELVLGVLDKNQLGSGADYGLVHAFHELYGAHMTGQLLTGMGRLFASYLQMHGFTCGMDDLIVDPKYDQKRLDLVQNNLQAGFKAATTYCGYTKLKLPKEINLYNRSTYNLKEIEEEKEPNKQYLDASHKAYRFLELKLLSDKHADEVLDGEYKKSMSKNSSEIVSSTLQGLSKRFPLNLFSCMTLTGAKGSNVNHSQVSVQLGQQELEGRRVPVMASGRSLPSFLPYDPNPRAGGYIADRFLTGLRPQEFFFHCMAGREGLIDTAVKTSRSGYLQRCLIKHLENLVVHYDLTVRDADGSLVQMYYGEDGIDTTKTKYLEKYQFLSSNLAHLKNKYKLKEFKKKLDSTKVQEFLKERQDNTDTIMSHFRPGTALGAISERVNDSFLDFSKKNPSKQQKTLSDLNNLRYIYSLAQPGDGVGCIAAQSVGEPSTQMTLNTFHLAGHGEKNVTLGIPRLRELLMTGTKKMKTPTMSLTFNNKEITKQKAELYARRLSKLVMLELVKSIEVQELKLLQKNKVALPPHQRGISYTVNVNFEDLDAIQYCFGISAERLNLKMQKEFAPLLVKLIDSELRKDNHRMTEKSNLLLKKAQPDYTPRKKSNVEDDDDEELIEEEENDDKIDILDEDESQTQKETNTTPQKIAQPIQNLKYVESINYSDGISTIILRLPLNSKKILMTNIVRKCLTNTVVQEIKGIQNAKVLKNDKPDGPAYYIFTEGVNLKAARHLDFIDPNQIESNDIGAIFQTFGIEAARSSIINEILQVFNAYGVGVDPRHLLLIGDYMTFGGVTRAMNRTWMEYAVSPFLKMSFETSTQFLSNVCTQRQWDDLSSMSSQLVVGNVPKVGTALCDVFFKVPEDDEEEEMDEEQ